MQSITLFTFLVHNVYAQIYIICMITCYFYISMDAVFYLSELASRTYTKYNFRILSTF